MKGNFSLTDNANSKRACSKIKALIDTARLARSFQQFKDKLRNLKNSYKQAKDNNKRSGSALQTSAYFDDSDQVLGTRDEISLQDITLVGVEEELLLPD